MLGTLAGISIAFIAMSRGLRDVQRRLDRARDVRDHPAVVDGRRPAAVRHPGRPGGDHRRHGHRLAVVLRLRLDGPGPDRRSSDSFAQFGIHLPVPATEVLSGLTDVAPLLATAIPLGVYNFTEGMNNVESASAAGDNYNLRYILLADGIGAVVGSFLGSPFPPAVYIGHPGWKAVGGRIGYSLATGVVIALICFLGLVGLFLAVIPRAALFPILLFIGLVIGVAGVPDDEGEVRAGDRPGPRPEHRPVGEHAWSTTPWPPPGRTPATVGFDVLAGNGVLYSGMAILGSGAVLAGLMLGAIAVFVIDKAVQPGDRLLASSRRSSPSSG